MKILSIAVLVFLVGCGPAREIAFAVTPGIPDRDPTCVVNLAQTCHGKLPVICHAEDHRWWPMLQRRPDGTQRECVTSCVVDSDGVAGCSGE